MHSLLDKAAEDMTADHFNFKPGEGGGAAFFPLWHHVHIENNIINRVVRSNSTVWNGLFGVCLTQGNRHVDEIEYARGVQGLGGLTI